MTSTFDIQQEDYELDDCITKIVGAATVYQEFNRDEDGIALRQYIEDLEAIVERLATRRAVEVLRAFEPLMRDHSKCLDTMSCIGYQNAASDFDNEKAIKIAELTATDESIHPADNL